MLILSHSLFVLAASAAPIQNRVALDRSGLAQPLAPVAPAARLAPPGCPDPQGAPAGKADPRCLVRGAAKRAAAPARPFGGLAAEVREMMRPGSAPEAAQAAASRYWGDRRDAGAAQPVDVIGFQRTSGPGAPAHGAPEAGFRNPDPPSLPPKEDRFKPSGFSLKAWVFRQVNRFVPWYKLPTPLAVLNLSALRDDLRNLNLKGTYQLLSHDCGASRKTPERWKGARSPDGSYNDLLDPCMGAAGAPFGRNHDLTKAKPGAVPGEPPPRLVAEKLLARKGFKPAKIVNVLVGAWIQFMVHDWVAHKRDTQGPKIEIPLRPGERWIDDRLRVERNEAVTGADRGPGAPGVPVYRNQVTHWWDASQLYGSDMKKQESLRTFKDGQLKLDEEGRLPQDPAFAGTDGTSGVDLTGFNDNYWVGLSLLHNLFAQEHNAVAKRLKEAYPEMTDDALFDKARLVVSALMAKIHTVEWTPAILPNPALQIGMKANWWGLLGKEFKRRFGGVVKSEILTGIPGTKTDHHTADYSLTEDFDVVYLMHPLIPDQFQFYSASSGQPIGAYSFKDIQGAATRGALSTIGSDNAFYSLGIAHPGALTLNNFPESLRSLEHIDGRKLDLAAIDIIRTRERGVPRYNEFRRSLRLPPARSFSELAGGDAKLAAELSEVYGGDIEKVDTVVGMFAETPPPGFGFSDTAFRVFILMASRRLKSDRFLSQDYRPEVYTPVGHAWVENTTMKDVLLRHHPGLSRALQGIENPFRGTWNVLAEEGPR